LINKTKNIPQMVYFGFDDALTPVVAPYYKKLFRSDRVNPNGCSIGMTLFVSHKYTSYADVKYSNMVNTIQQQNHLYLTRILLDCLLYCHSYIKTLLFFQIVIHYQHIATRPHM
jgi:hypothetical protein